MKVEVVGRLRKKPKRLVCEKGSVFYKLKIVSTSGEESISYFTAVLTENDTESTVKFLNKGNLVRVCGDLKFKVYAAKNSKQEIEKIITNAEIECLSTKRKRA